jgi:hypothetical protein
MNPKSSRSLLVLAAAMLACGSDPGRITDPEPTPNIPLAPLRVLFVGNSLTYYNDLPGMLEDMGSAAGQQIETVDVSQGGFALEDHWNTGPARDSLDNGRWNVVVLQQGASHENLEMWAVTWANAIRAADARPALYMIWPVRARLDDFPTVILSYRTAAEVAGAELYAAGEAWQAAWSTDPDLPLYGPDGIHPSVMGSYLAALAIYRGMMENEPPSLTDLGISVEDDAVLQAAAAAAQPISH